MVLKCIHDVPSPVATSSLPALLCHLLAYMYISQNSIHDRQVDKLYLFFIGTKCILAIFLTFRQVIHIGKYTFRQVSLYWEWSRMEQNKIIGIKIKEKCDIITGEPFLLVCMDKRKTHVHQQME